MIIRALTWTNPDGSPGWLVDTLYGQTKLEARAAVLVALDSEPQFVDVEIRIVERDDSQCKHCGKGRDDHSAAGWCFPGDMERHGRTQYERNERAFAETLPDVRGESDKGGGS
jgi:hypothetical protein